MTDTEQTEIAAVTLNVETADGETMIAIPVREPANAERVMDLMAAMDDVLVDIDPENQDAVMAALILAMGNALRQAPEWPLEARLDSFSRFVQSMIADTKAFLDV